MKALIPNLQILRFVAAAMVLFSHVQHQALKVTFLDKLDYEPWTQLYLAGGVDIFFVISGFIMYTIAHADFGRQGSSAKFFLRRLVRIVPPYWFFTLAMMVAAVLFREQITHAALAPDHILASFLFFPYLNTYGTFYPVLMLGWTLNYEVFFYVVFGLALLLPRRPGLMLIFGVIGALAVGGMYDVFSIFSLAYWSNPIVLEFLFGILLGMAYQRGTRLPRWLSWSLIGLGVVAMLLLKKFGIAEHVWTWRFLWMGLPALTISAGAVLRNDSGALGPVRRGLVFLGDASYALYLSHPFALNVVSLACARFGVRGVWTYVALACAISLLVAAAVHVLLEKPVTRYLNGRVNGWLKHKGLLAAA